MDIYYSFREGVRNMPENKNDIDSFWDISSMIPVKKTTLRKPASDTEAVTIDTGNPAREQGENIPISVPRAEQTIHRQKSEYSNETGFIRKVELIPWGNFTFYSKFHADAEKYFDAKSDECEYEYFFSYMPQYEQMSIKQMRYYLFWRSQVRNGIYPPVDSSYIFLYVYETINLNTLLSPEERLDILFDILLAYRGRYPYLDRYIGEWMCDICLIDRISPTERMREMLKSISMKISLPEIMADGNDGYFGYDFICSACGYDHKKSKVYSEHKQEWDVFMPASVERAVGAMINAGDLPEVFSHTVRDSFSGAIAYSGVKYKIAVTYISIRKNKDIHSLFSAVSKFAENELRAACGVKSRYKIQKIPPSAEKAIKDYFDAYFPERHLRKKSTDDSEEYMKYYAPRRVGEADIARALRIEEAAWGTARLLEAEIEYNTEKSAPDAPGAPPKADALAARRDMAESEFSLLLSSLDDMLYEALKAAERSEMKKFCKTNSLLTDDIIRRINEIASETMADMIIDETGELIDDYREDIMAAIKEKEER